MNDPPGTCASMAVPHSIHHSCEQSADHMARTPPKTGLSAIPLWHRLLTLPTTASPAARAADPVEQSLGEHGIWRVDPSALMAIQRESRG
jgi:hypothetical protein